MLQKTRILIWRIVAIVALVLGLIGVALPVAPTAPFLILAAWAAGKGWPALEERLLAHPVYGEHIRQWREHGAVARRAKWLASIMMLGSGVGLQFTEMPQWLKFGLPAFLFALAIWLWTRPEPAGRSG
ncbi:MAG: YbaN family protein [Steroidobacter sp.]